MLLERGKVEEKMQVAFHGFFPLTQLYQGRDLQFYREFTVNPDTPELSLCARCCASTPSSINAEELRHLSCGEAWGVLTITGEKRAFLPTLCCFRCTLFIGCQLDRLHKGENHQTSYGYGKNLCLGAAGLKDTHNDRGKGPLRDCVPPPHFTVGKPFLQQFEKAIENTLGEI